MKPRPIPDQERFDRAVEAWRAGRLSFAQAARDAGVSRDFMRMRLPEFEAHNSRKRLMNSARYHQGDWRRVLWFVSVGLNRVPAKRWRDG